jgi:hypothetical protein
MKEVSIKLSDMTPKELIAALEKYVEDGVIVNIEGMGVIDDTPAGKHLLNEIVSLCNIE